MWTNPSGGFATPQCVYLWMYLDRKYLIPKEVIFGRCEPTRMRRSFVLGARNSYLRKIIACLAQVPDNIATFLFFKED